MTVSMVPLLRFWPGGIETGGLARGWRARRGEAVERQVLDGRVVLVAGAEEIAQGRELGELGGRVVPAARGVGNDVVTHDAEEHRRAGPEVAEQLGAPVDRGP